MNYKDEIKVCAFDFDGTLIDFNYNVTEYTKTALRKLSENGYKVALATGRPSFMGLKGFRKAMGDIHIDYVLGCNGSEIMDVNKNETNIMFPLSAEDVRYIGKVLDSEYMALGIYDGEQFLVNKPVDSPELIEWMNARWITPKLFDYSTNDKPRSKVIVINEKKNREKEIEFLKTVDLSRVNGFFSSPYCFEIAPKGVSKATSCEYLCKLLNCNMNQILSFGDNDNDMPMLLATTGVIMENARDELKAQISLHTDRVDGLGIYDFLSRNGLI